jgi:hypothetical protein|tara:strand:- start:172 stop:375 length:204 start_codon:yes stop_codon:yes gene_type:complete
MHFARISKAGGLPLSDADSPADERDDAAEDKPKRREKKAKDKNWVKGRIAQEKIEEEPAVKEEEKKE